MKIFNAMFSTDNGGVEQIFLNYTLALQMQGHEVVSLIHPWAEIRKLCSKKHTKTLFSWGSNDAIAAKRLQYLLKSQKPDCIITHTKRAAFLFKKTKTTIPIVGVCHSSQLYPDLEKNSDAVIVVAQSMISEIKTAHTCEKKIYIVPNMIQMPKQAAFQKPATTNIPVIGVSARFSKLKGIDIFIEALAELKKKNLLFKALIAGDGKQKKQYLKQIKHHSLENEISLLGWIENKNLFYNQLDIFCHPSLKESFGLVVVESMMHSLPLVITNTAGPLEIVGDSECALIVPAGDVIGLAAALEQLIKDKVLAKQLAQKGFQRSQQYSIDYVAPKLNQVITDFISKQEH